MGDTSQKICTRCRLTKPLSRFYRDKGNSDGYRYECKDCNRVYWQEHCESKRTSRRKWTHHNREKHNEYSKRCNRRLRAEMILAFGGRCECCGESQPEFLTLDHKA